MPKGFSTKREREYKEIERKLEKEHRAQSGETKSSKRALLYQDETASGEKNNFNKLINR